MRDQGTRPDLNDDIPMLDGSQLTDEERQLLKASASLLAEIAVADGPVPMQCLKNIGAMLGWDRERTQRVARQIARFGLISKRSEVRAAYEEWQQSQPGGGHVH
jgi:hypothetical protein